jgi:methanogenic corrinoid protein MtbC1
VEASDLTTARLGVTSAALAGDPGRLYHIVSGLLGDGVSFDRVLFDLLMPAERELGHRWQQGDYLVSEEHAATATIETVISLLAGSFDQPDDAPTVVVATAEGDDHSLPARAAAAHLLFLGYRTLFLGANVLAEDLAEYLESEDPDALVLSCAMGTHLPGARAVIAASHQAGVPVIAGGKGFGRDGRWANAIGADEWVGSLKEIAGTLETWTPDTEDAETRARKIDDDLQDLIDRWPALVADARKRIPEGKVPPAKNPRALAELGLALDATIASVLVDDTGVAEEMLGWQKSTLPVHGLDAHEEMIEGLIAALQDVSADAARVLRSVFESL